MNFWGVVLLAFHTNEREESKRQTILDYYETYRLLSVYLFSVESERNWLNKRHDREDMNNGYVQQP